MTRPGRGPAGRGRGEGTCDGGDCLAVRPTTTRTRAGHVGPCCYCWCRCVRWARRGGVQWGNARVGDGGRVYWGSFALPRACSWRATVGPLPRGFPCWSVRYTRSVCSTPFLFRCAAPDQVRCSRSGAVPARRHRQAAEALCASVLESARAQASAGARDRSALNPFDRTARPRRHLPNARKASRQSLQPGYETPPPSG